MKLLCITREFPPVILGGLSYHLTHLYSEIASEHEVTILAGHCHEVPETADLDIPDNLSVDTFEYRSINAHHLRVPFNLYQKLDEYELSQFDIAFTHTAVPFDLSIPTIAKFHDCKYRSRTYSRRTYSRTEQIADSLLQPTRRAVYTRSLKSADHHIFISELCRDCWYSNHSRYEDNTVIYNGVDTSIFYPCEVDQEEFYLFVGAGERKGLQRVLDFAEQTGEEVIIVGNVGRTTPDTVTVHGRVNQSKLAELYSQARATIHPANFEAFGNIILESLACGTPVVASPNCGASELLTGETGVVNDNLAAGVERLGHCSSEACVELAREHTWEDVAERTIEVAKQYV